MAVDKKNVISIRLTDEEFKPFVEIMEKTGLGKTELFKTLLLNRGNQIIVKEQEKDFRHFKKCLFYYSKTSNNMNQIAHRLNKDNAKNIIDDLLYKRLLNTLINIKNALEGGLK